jgi:hypothetical protein
MVLMSSIYEFIQRRADWKKIEKTVDKVSSDSNPRPKLMLGNVRPVGQRRLCYHVEHMSGYAASWHLCNIVQLDHPRLSYSSPTPATPRSLQTLGLPVSSPLNQLFADCWALSSFHLHSTPCLSSRTLTVAHENRTIPLYPKTGSIESFRYACVRGSDDQL